MHKEYEKRGHEEAALVIAIALEPYGYELGETHFNRGQWQTWIEAPYGHPNREKKVLLNGTTAQIFIANTHRDGVRWPEEQDGQKVVQRLRKHGMVTREEIAEMHSRLPINLTWSSR